MNKEIRAASCGCCVVVVDAGVAVGHRIGYHVIDGDFSRVN